MVQTATMIQGYGDAYRQGLADWHAIIDGLAKPTFDGVLPLADLAAAVAEARAAATPDPRQVALKRTIAEIRARALECRRRCSGGVSGGCLPILQRSDPIADVTALPLPDAHEDRPTKS